MVEKKFGYYVNFCINEGKSGTALPKSRNSILLAPSVEIKKKEDRMVYYRKDTISDRWMGTFCLKA